MAPGDSPVLVVGGTGRLGRPTVVRLREAGQEVRVLSRRAAPERPDHVLGDLRTGAGIRAALDGVRTVIHLVQSATAEDELTRTLADAAAAAGVEHLVYISIVGIERNRALGYYAVKLRSERVLETSAVPHTIVRATQFHDFVAGFVDSQRRLPIAFLPRAAFQPIAVDEVAARLVEVAAGPAMGRAADIGGPEQLTLDRIARLWYQAHGRDKRVVALPSMGSAMRNYRAGTQLGTLPGYGQQTFAEFAAARGAQAAQVRRHRAS